MLGGEVNVKRSKKHNILRGGRFDIVIFNQQQKAIAVIEVKNSFRKNITQIHSKTKHYQFITHVPQFTFYEDDPPDKLICEIKSLLE